MIPCADMPCPPGEAQHHAIQERGGLRNRRSGRIGSAARPSRGRSRPAAPRRRRADRGSPASPQGTRVALHQATRARRQTPGLRAAPSRSVDAVAAHRRRAQVEYRRDDQGRRAHGDVLEDPAPAHRMTNRPPSSGLATLATAKTERGSSSACLRGEMMSPDDGEGHGYRGCWRRCPARPGTGRAGTCPAMIPLSTDPTGNDGGRPPGLP